MRHLLLTSILSSALVMTGCANDGASLFVTSVVGLSDDCIVDPSVALVNGVVDIVDTDNLTIYPVFASQLRDRVSPSASNPADLHVRWVDVRLSDLGGNVLSLGLPNPFRVPTSVFIEGFPGTGTANTATGAVQVLPPGYPAAVAAATGGSVLAEIRPIGRTNGGIKVKGNYDFQIQIQICSGCLTRCAGADEEETFACVPGQNELSIVNCP
jgi:hypothetical protein